MKTVIMAGGRGTRIASVASNIPKPMIALCGKPILQYQIENLKASGISDIIIVVGYLGHIIQDYFGDGSRFGVHISYIVETEALGTAGALFLLGDEQEDILLILGDILFDFDFSRFLAFFEKQPSLAVVVAHPSGHTFDSSIVVIQSDFPAYVSDLPDEGYRIIAWLNREDKRLDCKNLVNCGVHILSAALLKMAREQFQPLDASRPAMVDLDRNILKPFVATGQIYAYKTCEYLKDVGTPGRYHEAEYDILTGKLAARRIGVKKRTVFIDEKLVLDIGGRPQPNIIMPLLAINKAGYILLQLIDSSPLDKGECSFAQIDRYQRWVAMELGEKGAFFDGLYYYTSVAQAFKDFSCDETFSFVVLREDRDLPQELAGMEKVILSPTYNLQDFVSEKIIGF